ncbi:MAG: Gfo/Idh/MocA family oxidoreductase [Kiritimatiellae bacterium]|nr:Gfo/Idh/MocA family oxidoreductase [Kiritimatiellia bacterium]
MRKDKWRIGLVGAHRGKGYGSLLAGHPRCELVACCDSSEQTLAGVQEAFRLSDAQCFLDYDAFIAAGMDAVLLATPIPVHARQTITALEAGVHVLCEVTAASTVEDCARIVDTVRRTGKTYMLAENCVFWPFVRDWKAMVGSGRLGEVIYAECEYLHPIPAMIVDPETRAPRWRAARAPLHYCSHSLGPILEITGDRIVRAMGLGQGHRILPEAPVGGIDIQVALFETEKNAIIKLLRTSVAPRHPGFHFYLIQGTKGFVESARDKTGGTGRLYVRGEMKEARVAPCSLVDESLPKEAQAGGHGTAEYVLVEEFLDALDLGRKPSIDEVRAMDMTVPGLVAHESAMNGGVWLDVPRFG